MSFQERICKAFCAEVKVTPFKGGFGVSTPFLGSDGDALGYYVVGPNNDGRFNIVDNSLTVALFESQGATLDSETRLSAFNEIVANYGGVYDEEDGEIRIESVAQNDIERRSLDFMALLLRLQDMYLLTQDRVKNTFHEDVENKLNSVSVPGLTISKDESVSQNLTEVIPDYILRKAGLNKPVALFVVSQSEKLWQAMYFKTIAQFEVKLPVSVVALLQSDKTGTAQLRAKADNRLDAVPKWANDEAAALGRVLMELDVATAPMN